MVTVGGCQTKLRTKSGSRSPLFDWNTDRHQCQDKTRQEKTEVSLWLLMKYQVLGTIQMVLENWGLQAEHSPDVSSCSLRLHHRSGRPGWAGTHTPPWLHLPPKHTHTHTHEEQTVNWLAWTQGKYYTEQLLHVTSYCTSVWMCVSVGVCVDDTVTWRFSVSDKTKTTATRIFITTTLTLPEPENTHTRLLLSWWLWIISNHFGRVGIEDFLNQDLVWQKI